MIPGKSSGGKTRARRPEVFATTAITSMCTAGVSFHLRFLVELCRDPIEGVTGPGSDSAMSKRRSLVGRTVKNQCLA
jgi:hypothetical protein